MEWRELLEKFSWRDSRGCLFLQDGKKQSRFHVCFSLVIPHNKPHLRHRQKTNHNENRVVPSNHTQSKTAFSPNIELHYLDELIQLGRGRETKIKSRVTFETAHVMLGKFFLVLVMNSFL